MPKKQIIILSAVIAILILGGVAYGGYYMMQNQRQNYGGGLDILCPGEVKTCSDGSSVHRVAPNCEFAACPEIKKDATADLSSKASATEDWQTYKNDKYGFEVRYPAILSLNAKGEGAELTHSVAYRHPDPCDFKGDRQPLERITDFNVMFRIYNFGLQDAVKANETDYLMKIFFSGGAIKTSPGFIDEFSVSSWRGYRVTSGVEGCGRFTYYFPISENKILFVSRAFISEFKPIIADYQKYLNVSSVIPPNQEENYFKQILSTFKFTK